MSEEQAERTSVYSYHTFIFPFLWNNGGEVQRDDFERCIDKTRWKHDLFGEFCDRDRTDDLRRERYAQYQYFNAPARRAIYTTEENSQTETVHNYLYMPELLAKDDAAAYYIISKGEQTYSLLINGLRLKLYNSGIGLLVYELKNTDYTTIEEVNRINEYGRRIYCPYIYDVNNLTSSLTADSIRMEGEGFPSAADDEWRIAADASDAEITPKTKPAKIVTMLLTSGDVSVTTDEGAASEDKLYIEPIIDDRMFVACFVKDKSFIDQMMRRKCGEYRWLSDALDKVPNAPESAARRLYEFVFVDGNGITCANRNMIRSLLERHVYARWAEYGTMFGITEYSMVCVSSAEEDHIAKESFLTQYIELAMLALAQRASLIAFERQISLVSDDLKKARQLMSDYVRFQSQILLNEVTPQQQGIELYNMLLEKLYVKKQKDDVENRIRNLFELKNFRVEKRVNCILLFTSIIGIASVVDVILSWIGLK